MTLLALDTLTVRRGLCPVVDAVSLSVVPGECVGLIGPNGAGKTTLMRGALGLLPHEGLSSLAAISSKERSRRVAWLPQKREIAWPVAVHALVALGRLPHLPRGTRLRPEDAQAVDAALEEMGLSAFRDRPATELSGGEQARVLIARALAQDTPLLMADEPTAGLDPAAQIATLTLFRALAERGRGVLVSLHDINQAARYCTRVIVMHAGKVAADGAPADVLTPDLMEQVFHVRVDVRHSAHGPLLDMIEVIR